MEPRRLLAKICGLGLFALLTWVCSSQVAEAKDLSEIITYDHFEELLRDVVARVPDYKPIWDYNKAAPSQEKLSIGGGGLRIILHWLHRQLQTKPAAEIRRDPVPPLARMIERQSLLDLDIFGTKGAIEKFKASEIKMPSNLHPDFLDLEFYEKWSVPAGGTGLEKVRMTPDEVADALEGLRDYHRGRLKFYWSSDADFARAQAASPNSRKVIVLRYLNILSQMSELKPNEEEIARIKTDAAAHPVDDIMDGEKGSSDPAAVAKAADRLGAIQKQLAKLFIENGFNFSKMASLLEGVDLLRRLAMPPPSELAGSSRDTIATLIGLPSASILRTQSRLKFAIEHFKVEEAARLRAIQSDFDVLPTTQKMLLGASFGDAAFMENKAERAAVQGRFHFLDQIMNLPLRVSLRRPEEWKEKVQNIFSQVLNFDDFLLGLALLSRTIKPFIDEAYIRSHLGASFPTQLVREAISAYKKINGDFKKQNSEMIELLSHFGGDLGKFYTYLSGADLKILAADKNLSKTLTALFECLDPGMMEFSMAGGALKTQHSTEVSSKVAAILSEVMPSSPSLMRFYREYIDQSEYPRELDKRDYIALQRLAKYFPADVRELMERQAAVDTKADVYLAKLPRPDKTAPSCAGALARLYGALNRFSSPNSGS